MANITVLPPVGLSTHAGWLPVRVEVPEGGFAEVRFHKAPVQAPPGDYFGVIRGLQNVSPVKGLELAIAFRAAFTHKVGGQWRAIRSQVFEQGQLALPYRVALMPAGTLKSVSGIPGVILEELSPKAVQVQGAKLGYEDDGWTSESDGTYTHAGRNQSFFPATLLGKVNEDHPVAQRMLTPAGAKILADFARTKDIALYIDAGDELRALTQPTQRYVVLSRQGQGLYISLCDTGRGSNVWALGRQAA